LDYIDVAARIVEFRTKHPHGSLQCIDLKFIDFAGKSWVVYTAAAYRTPDDERPGIGTAWEPVPGPTQFTRDSEVQNAETAAWGRAMVAALAVDTKKGIASKEEVRNRQLEATEKEVKADPVKRAAPSAPLSSVQQQIKDGLEMLSPDERAVFGEWWVSHGYTKGVQNLQPQEAEQVWAELFARLNASEPSQGNLDPSEVLLSAFPNASSVDTVSAPLASNAQIGKIRALLGKGSDVHAEVARIIKREVSSLNELTKDEASHVITNLGDSK
jgi:hypothetical protein